MVRISTARLGVTEKSSSSKTMGLMACIESCCDAFDVCSSEVPESGGGGGGTDTADCDAGGGGGVVAV
jgi:hypothetical protein